MSSCKGLKPNKRILDLSKIKSFADDNSDVAHTLEIPFDRVENSVGKEGHVGYHNAFFLFLSVVETCVCVGKGSKYFLLFLTFSKGLFP